MRTLCIFASTLTLFLAPAPVEEIGFKVEKGTKLEKTFEHLLELNLESMSVEFGGEEVPADEMGEFEMHITSTEKLVFVDEYRAVADGKPTLLARKFESLEGEEKQSSSMDGESDEESKSQESKLEGRTVLFKLGEDGEEWTKSYEGDGGDDELLEGLVEDSDLRFLLPSGKVAAGDKWKVDGKEFNALLAPGGDLGLESEDEDEEDDDTDEQLDDNLAGEVTITFVGMRDEGGVSCAVLGIEAKLETRAETSKTEDEESTTEIFEVDLEIEGELLWNMASGRPHTLALEGDTAIAIRNKSEMTYDGEHFEMSQNLKLAGKSKFTASWVAAE